MERLLLMLRSALSLLVLTVCVAACGDRQTQDADARAELDAAFEQGFERSGAVGAIAGLWIPGGVSWVATKGLADRQTGEPMSRPMQAPIGSVTKTYTGLVALQLVSEGVLSLDATIDRWYPAYPEASAITLRMLLNHSSGIADISNLQLAIKCSDPHEIVAPDVLIDMSTAQPRAPFAPGQGFAYSSANTIIVGRIIEKVTGASYADVLAQRLFEPLGLERTRLDTDGVLQPPYAHGYTNFCAPTFPDGTDTSSWTMLAFSGGALAATIDDLHAYGVAFGEGFGLSDALKEARLNETAPTDDTSGLGLVVQRDPANGRVVSIGHAGAEPGYGATLVYYPCSGAVFAFMGNVDFDPAVIEILRAVQPVVEELATGSCASERGAVVWGDRAAHLARAS